MSVHEILELCEKNMSSGDYMKASTLLQKVYDNNVHIKKANVKFFNVPVKITHNGDFILVVFGRLNGVGILKYVCSQINRDTYDDSNTVIFESNKLELYLKLQLKINMVRSCDINGYIDCSIDFAEFIEKRYFIDEDEMMQFTETYKIDLMDNYEKDFHKHITDIYMDTLRISII